MVSPATLVPRPETEFLVERVALPDIPRRCRHYRFWTSARAAVLSLSPLRASGRCSRM